MRKLAIAVAVSGTFAAGAAQAASFQNSSGLTAPAYVETFDSPASDGLAAGSLFAGMTFGSHLVVTSIYDGSFGGVSGQSIVNFDAEGIFSPSFVSFANVLTDVGFLFVTNPGASTFTAYLNDMLIESFTAPTDLSNPVQYYGFTGISFDQIRIDSGGANNAFLLDNMQFNTAAPIPEPETYAMLLAGLGLLGFAARRRKLKEAASV